MSFNGVAPAAVPVVLTSITFVTVSFLVVCTRMFTRWRLLNNVGLDDYFMVGALVRCNSVVSREDVRRRGNRSHLSFKAEEVTTS